MYAVWKQKSGLPRGKEGIRQAVEKGEKGRDTSRRIMNYETVEHVWKCYDETHYFACYLKNKFNYTHQTMIEKGGWGGRKSWWAAENSNSQIMFPKPAAYHHRGMSHKCKLSGPIQDLLNEKLGIRSTTVLNLSQSCTHNCCRTLARTGIAVAKVEGWTGEESWKEFKWKILGTISRTERTERT